MNFIAEFRLASALVAACLAFLPIGSAFANEADAKDVHAQTGIASYYGDSWNNLPTASGERFDQKLFTGATCRLPLGAWVKVTNLLNGKSVNVRINDRNAATSSRIIDLSQAAAKAVGMMRSGLAKVRIERIFPGKTHSEQVAEIVPEPPRKPDVE